MRKSVKLRVEQSELHQRIRDLNALETLTDEQRAELDAATRRVQAIEIEVRAALVSESESERVETRDASNLTPEQRERLELRGQANLGAYVAAAISGRQVAGAEAELQQAAGVPGIPFELWERRADLERRARIDAGGSEHRAVTGTPGTVGLNLDLIRPEIFAPSIATRLLLEMPMVESGTYAVATIKAGANARAGAVAAGADVPQEASAFNVVSTTPHRVGAQLGLRVEDIAAVGQANFEAALRDNIQMVLADEIDDQLINGAGGTDLTGLADRLTDVADPAADVETFNRFVGIAAAGIDGLWANTLADVAMVVNPETFRLAVGTFQTGNSSDKSTSQFFRQELADFWTNKRMPDKANHVAPGIICRKGRMGIRTAVAPHWGYLSIDDVYSGARKGERYFTVSVLLGDVIVVQPGAYAQTRFRVST